MKFTDFTPEELIGKIVLVRGKRKNYLSKIVKVNKTSFKIGSVTSSDNFRLSDGELKGGDHFHYGTCKLITEQEAKELIEKDVIAKELINAKYNIKQQLNLTHSLVDNFDIDQINTLLKVLKDIHESNNSKNIPV